MVPDPVTGTAGFTTCTEEGAGDELDVLVFVGGVVVLVGLVVGV